IPIPEDDYLVAYDVQSLTNNYNWIIIDQTLSQFLAYKNTNFTNKFNSTPEIQAADENCFCKPFTVGACIANLCRWPKSNFYMYYTFVNLEPNVEASINLFGMGLGGTVNPPIIWSGGNILEAGLGKNTPSNSPMAWINIPYVWIGFIALFIIIVSVLLYIKNKKNKNSKRSNDQSLPAQINNNGNFGNNDNVQTFSSLPPNWLQQQDPQTGNWFYVNTTTGQSQWNPPI
ncbi:hypothetical protein HK099_000145, partial [Clydaea vesicula]